MSLFAFLITSDAPTINLYVIPIKFDLLLLQCIAALDTYIVHWIGLGHCLFSEQNLILPPKQMLNLRYESQNTILYWWYHLLLNKSKLLYFYLVAVSHNYKCKKEE